MLRRLWVLISIPWILFWSWVTAGAYPEVNIIGKILFPMWVMLPIIVWFLTRWVIRGRWTQPPYFFR